MYCRMTAEPTEKKTLESTLAPPTALANVGFSERWRPINVISKTPRKRFGYAVGSQRCCNALTHSSPTQKTLSRAMCRNCVTPRTLRNLAPTTQFDSLILGFDSITQNSVGTSSAGVSCRLAVAIYCGFRCGSIHNSGNLI